MKTLTIGKLAKAAGVSRETIRYYEKRGILEDPARSASGYRRYSHNTIIRLRFIRHAKELGFSLNEINELLSLRLDSKTPSSEIKKRAQQKIQNIEEKILILQKMKLSLTDLFETCSGCGPVSQCPIMEALEQ